MAAVRRGGTGRSLDARQAAYHGVQLDGGEFVVDAAVATSPRRRHSLSHPGIQLNGEYNKTVNCIKLLYWAALKIRILFKGTQDWEFFWLQIWILYYFIVSSV